MRRLGAGRLGARVRAQLYLRRRVRSEAGKREHGNPARGQGCEDADRRRPRWEVPAVGTCPHRGRGLDG